MCARSWLPGAAAGPAGQAMRRPPPRARAGQRRPVARPRKPRPRGRLGTCGSSAAPAAGDGRGRGRGRGAMAIERCRCFGLRPPPGSQRRALVLALRCPCGEQRPLPARARLAMAAALVWGLCGGGGGSVWPGWHLLWGVPQAPLRSCPPGGASRLLAPFSLGDKGP